MKRKDISVLFVIYLFSLLIIASQQTVAEEFKIPSWIKNNAKWWSQGTMSDNDFVQGIQYLIKEKIVKIPETKTSSGQSTKMIPSWVKSNAGWWADGKISDGDFVKGIQYLVEIEIINVDTDFQTTTKNNQRSSSESIQDKIEVFLDTGSHDCESLIENTEHLAILVMYKYFPELAHYGNANLGDYGNTDYGYRAFVLWKKFALVKIGEERVWMKYVSEFRYYKDTGILLEMVASTKDLSMPDELLQKRLEAYSWSSDKRCR